MTYPYAPQPVQPVPPRRSLAWLWVLLGTTPLLIAVGLGSGALLAGQSLGPADPSGSPSGSARSTAARASASARPVQSPSASPLVEVTGKPTLGPGRGTQLVGPVFTDMDKTFTMQFEGWPFAFRVPEDFGCMAGTSSVLPSDAKLWVCVNEHDTTAHQKINIMLRRCPTTCTTLERTTMNALWLDRVAAAKRFGTRTYYVETPENDNGLYTVDLSHFFGSGGVLRWQVGVFVSSPPETRGTVQKVLNDILSQAG